MFVFWRICCTLFSCNTYFEICPFALLPTICFLLHELSDTTMTPQKIRLQVATQTDPKVSAKFSDHEIKSSV